MSRDPQIRPPLLPRQRRRQRRRAALGFEIPFGAASSRAPATVPEITAWIVIRPRRHRDHPHRQVRDGPGQLHRARHAGRRRARMRLEQGTGRIRPAAREPRAQPGLGRHVDRRQPGDPLLARDAAQGRRDRARDADRRGRGAVGTSRPAECRAAQGRDHARAERTHGALRHGRGGRRPHRAAQKSQAQGAEGLDARRQADQAPRGHRQGPGQDDLRHRRAACPDMLNAALVQCPVFKGALKSVDDAKASRHAGRPQGRQAQGRRRGRRRYLVAGQTGRRRAVDRRGTIAATARCRATSIREFLRTRARLRTKPASAARTAMSRTALAKAARRIEAEYYVPFLAHATLEPQNCTAHRRGGKVEIWVSTQNGEASLAAAAQAAGVPPRNVIVHKTMLGGGFGRRGAVQDFVPHAVLHRQGDGPAGQDHLVARRGHAARLLPAGRDGAEWSPASTPRARSTAWHVRMSRPIDPERTLRRSRSPAASMRTSRKASPARCRTTCPTISPTTRCATPTCRSGFWRCVNHTQNCFFRESFIDELAHAAGADPYAYRRAMLGGHRNAGKLVGVLDAAADKAQWTIGAAARRPSRHRAQRIERHVRRRRLRGVGATTARCGCTRS